MALDTLARLKSAAATAEQEHRPMILTVGLLLIQYGMAFIFIGFGGTKVYLYFVGTPGPPIVVETGVQIYNLLGFPDPAVFALAIGVWEVLIGLCFTRIRWIWFGLVQVIFIHLPATFIPFIIAPGLTFATFPYLISFEGLYIIKNIILLGGSMVVWALYHQQQ